MQPIYPNCFDMLTTHGIIHNDLVGYVTGTPSPYLQQYAARKGAATPVMSQTAAPSGAVLQQPVQPDVYQKPASQTPPQAPTLHSHNPKNNNIWKSIAMTLILSVGASLLLAKGVRMIKGTTVPHAPAGSPWYQKFLNLFKA